MFRRKVVAFRADDVRTAVHGGKGTTLQTFAFAGNWWYALDAPARSRPQLPTAERGGVYGRDPQFKDPEHGDFRRSGPPPSRGGRGTEPQQSQP